MSDQPISIAGLATIDDVARRAGVSTATVSRALHNHPYVAEATRQRVLQAAEELQYVANSNASRLASGKSRTIGLLAPLLTSWYAGEVVAGVEEVLASARFDLLIGTANLLARERMYASTASFHQRIDGIILVDVFCGDAGAAVFAELDTPVVVLGEQLLRVTSVSVDNERGAHLAARHLIDLGHRRLAVVGGHVLMDAAHTVPTERLHGFRAALAAAGIPLPECYVVDGAFTIDGGREAMHRFLALPEPPTGVFLMSDEMAYGALWALREAGLRPGRDVSLVGFDDHPVAEAVGLTTVRQPVREIGRLGARLMLDTLDGHRSATYHPIELTLVERETSGPPPDGASR